MKGKSIALAGLLTLAVAFGHQACSPAGPQMPKSFCYWDTSYRMDTTAYNQYGVDHLYIRYFDVDWDAASRSARPVATLRTNSPLSGRFTPAIFLTNTVFEKADTAALDSLAKRIATRIQTVNTYFESAEQTAQNISWNDTVAISKIHAKLDLSYRNILIDCDWTEGTRDKFFYFLNQIKKNIPNKEIDATLRLWQYKYRSKAGIPPVKRCLLMCYNMQLANDYSVTNSIATLDELKKYIEGKKYPLPLDVALPVFNWAILFRNQKSAGIIGNADMKTFSSDIENYQPAGKNRYRLLNDRVIGNVYARQGDEIRVESINGDELVKMSRYLAKQIGSDTARQVTFFSWNKSYLINYPNHELDEAISALTR